jgi:hypothetical protein
MLAALYTVSRRVCLCAKLEPEPYFAAAIFKPDRFVLICGCDGDAYHFVLVELKCNVRFICVARR